MIAILAAFLLVYLLLACSAAALIAYTQYLHHKTLVATTRVLYNPENPDLQRHHWTAQ